MRKFISIIIGLLGLSFVVIIHELGHLLAAKFYGVGAPLFSIGFGPEITGITWGQTYYQICILPLGGYVSLNQAQLNAQPFNTQAIIIIAGIAINIIFSYLIFGWFWLRHLPYREMLQSIMFGRSGIMGPIGIISLISYSATVGIDYFFLVLATISFSIGLFNLVPLPFLDGGQLLGFAREALQKSLPETNYINPLLGMILIILGMYLIIRVAIRSR
jgi:regulator of sigma E protease